MPEKKLCIILTSGEITELAGINGPVTKPAWINASIISSLVARGVKVVEVNPANKKETLELTRLNFNKVNFPAVKVVVHSDEKPIDKKIDEVPVVMSETKASVVAKKAKKEAEPEAEKVSTPDTFEA